MHGLADRIGKVLQARGRSLAVAESLTGGLLASRFARADASSEWFRGSIVAYSSEVKFDVLDVPLGPVVSAAAAASMAAGAARLLGASIAVSATGVGGPDEQDGQPPGTVWLGMWPPEMGDARLLHLRGDPGEICRQVCDRAVHLLAERLGA